MDPTAYAARLESITDVEAQVEALEAASEEIFEAPVEVLPAVLAMMERVAGQDDFGLMHPFGDWMEELDGSEEVAGRTVAEHVLGSLKRAVNYRTLEVSSGLCFDEEADRPSEAWFAGIREALARPGISEEDTEALQGALADYA